MKIVNFRTVHEKENQVAKFDVDLENEVLYPNIELWKGKNGGYWVRRPGYVKAKDPMGKITWGNYPEMSKEKEKSFNEKVRELLDPFLTRDFSNASTYDPGFTVDF